MRPGTQRKKREARYVCGLRLVVSPWVAGLAALARDTGVLSRGSRMSRWASSHLRCQTAQSSSFPRRVPAPGWCPCVRVRPRSRGGRSADRRTCS